MPNTRTLQGILPVDLNGYQTRSLTSSKGRMAPTCKPSSNTPWRHTE